MTSRIKYKLIHLLLGVTAIAVGCAVIGINLRDAREYRLVRICVAVPEVYDQQLIQTEVALRVARACSPPPSTKSLTTVTGSQRLDLYLSIRGRSNSKRYVMRCVEEITARLDETPPGIPNVPIKVTKAELLPLEAQIPSAEMVPLYSIVLDGARLSANRLNSEEVIKAIQTLQLSSPLNEVDVAKLANARIANEHGQYIELESVVEIKCEHVPRPIVTQFW